MRLDIFDERGKRRGELVGCHRDMTAVDLYASLREIVPDLRFLLVDEKIIRASDTRTLVEMFGRCREARVSVVGGRRREPSDSESNSEAEDADDDVHMCVEDMPDAPEMEHARTTDNIRLPDPVVRCRLLDDPGSLVANGIPPVPSAPDPSRDPCDRLVSMGFGLAAVVEALSATGNDAEAAMAFLVDDAGESTCI